MRPLFEFYLLGYYGNDLWNGNAPVVEPDQETDENQKKPWLPRLVGPIIPGVLLLAIAVFPGTEKFVGVDMQTLRLLIVTWFIIALDASLGLGVVEKIVTTANEIRQLR